MSIFNSAWNGGNTDRAGVLLKLVEAHLIDCDVEKAVQTWFQAGQELETPDSRILHELWKAELALAGRDELGNALSLMEQVQRFGLPHAEQLYLNGVLADTSPEAVSLFRQCTLTAPFHYRARRMLILTLLALGELDNASGEIRLARQLFPEDMDFKLLDSVCKTARLQLNEALLLIEQAGLKEPILEQWTEACRALHSLVNHPELDSGMGELDVIQLAVVLDTVSSKFIPLFQQRRWRLPLKIESRLSTLLLLPDLLLDDRQQSIDAVQKIAEIHPEGSMLIILGGLRLSVCNADPAKAAEEIPQLEQARAVYQKALQRPGFLKHDEQMIWKAIFTSSTILGITMKHDVETNHRLLLDSAAKVRCDSITTAPQARTFVILTMELGDNQAAGRWVDRWIELADNGDKTLQDAVWHKAVLCKRLEQWVEAMHWCDALLNANPDYPEVVPLRDFARTQLEDLLEGNTE